MKSGRRGYLDDDGATKELVLIRFFVLEATRSMMLAILSSSSGQMSGQ